MPSQRTPGSITLDGMIVKADRWMAALTDAPPTSGLLLQRRGG
jgi:hypothetical protein